MQTPTTSALPSPATHQLLYLVVGQPQLLQRVGHGLNVFNLFQQVAPQRQDAQAVHARQAADLLYVVCGQRQVPVLWCVVDDERHGWPAHGSGSGMSTRTWRCHVLLLR
jgi:hypothetical protein